MNEIRSAESKLYVEMVDACNKGKIDRVKELFDKKVPLDLAHEESGFTLMHYAIFKDNTALALWLLKNGASFDHPELTCKRTPLHLACEFGMTEVIDALLAKKAEIDCVDSKGCTPLHLACQANRVKSSELCAWLALRLFAAGANPKITNIHGHKPADLLKDTYFPIFNDVKSDHLPPFNADIWRKILEELPKVELYRNVMLTCKALYNLSILTLKQSFYKP